MNHEEYLTLYDKYLAGTASPEEISRIENYRDNFQLQESGNNRQDFLPLEKKILSRINQSIQNVPIRRLVVGRWSVAAAVLILFAAGSLLLRHREPPSSGKLQAPVAAVQQDVAPGANKAILILSDGRKIALTDAANGQLGQFGNISIQKTKDGQLEYVVGGGSGSASGDGADGVAGRPAISGLNTISTPRGGQYQVALPDGTRVWLNAASSLTFPVRFAGPERRVELTGEAYFEVAKNKDQPFKVACHHTEVQVLGTNFNIMAYPDEGEIKTTLLDGSVKIKNGSDEQLLVPGQQAIDKSEGRLRVVEANLEEVVAWKNGYFIFHNTDIHDIMRQAARWYDVEVAYEGNPKDAVFGGKVSKFRNISVLLKNLELAGSVHFNVQGKKVTVTE
jgi:transmembrane sensor